MTYNGDGLLTQTQYSFLNGGGGCPFIPGHDGRTRTGRARGSGPRRHARRGITNRCYWTDYLTWNTALGGVPTLASDDTWDPGGNNGPEDYIMGPQGLPIEQLYGGNSDPMWYYDDFSGDTRALVDSSDTIETQNYPLFGTSTNHWSGSGIDTPLEFAGMYNDGWTNLEYDQARFYDPSTGQFLSTDPPVAHTLQPFSYAADNPVSNGDPTGRNCADSVSGGGAGPNAGDCPGGGGNEDCCGAAFEGDGTQGGDTTVDEPATKAEEQETEKADDQPRGESNQQWSNKFFGDTGTVTAKPFGLPGEIWDQVSVEDAEGHAIDQARDKGLKPTEARTALESPDKGYPQPNKNASYPGSIVYVKGRVGVVVDMEWDNELGREYWKIITMWKN